MSLEGSGFVLPPPAIGGRQPVYLPGADANRLTALNSASGITLTLRGRFLPVPREDMPNPHVTVFAHDFVPATNRSATSITRPLGEGWLLDFGVHATGGTPTLGQCYVVVGLTRGVEAS